VPSIYEFCDFIKRKYRRLDILINNAAQTIRREPGLNEPIVRKEFQVDITQDRELLSVLPGDFENKRINGLLRD
jgi:short-subunit dehydrogenase involved in D-alanine esterification of teichoic acids